MLNQGMRPEEGTSLAKAGIDMERGQIHIRKGKSSAARRTLDMTSKPGLILGRRMAGNSPWVFPSKRRPGKNIGRLNNAHDNLLEKAAKAGPALDFVLYGFRHSFSTGMAEATGDLATPAAILGHGSILTVQKYAHPTADHKRSPTEGYDMVFKLAAQKSEQGLNSRVN